VPCTGVGAGAGGIEDAGLGAGLGEDDVPVGVGAGLSEDDVDVGVGMGAEEGQDTQNTFCLAAPCSPVKFQKSL
jgi:hypothetical protein